MVFTCFLRHEWRYYQCNASYDVSYYKRASATVSALQQQQHQPQPPDVEDTRDQKPFRISNSLLNYLKFAFSNRVDLISYAKQIIQFKRNRKMQIVVS